MGNVRTNDAKRIGLGNALLKRRVSTNVDVVAQCSDDGGLPLLQRSQVLVPLTLLRVVLLRTGVLRLAVEPYSAWIAAETFISHGIRQAIRIMGGRYRPHRQTRQCHPSLQVRSTKYPTRGTPTWLHALWHDGWHWNGLRNHVRLKQRLPHIHDLLTQQVGMHPQDRRATTWMLTKDRGVGPSTSETSSWRGLPGHR